MTATRLCPQGELQLPPASLRDSQDQQVCLLLSNYCCCSGSLQFSLVQSLSHVRLFATPWTTARQASLSSTSSQSLLKLKSIELVMPSNHLIFCFLLLLLLSTFHSIIFQDLK